MTVFWDASKLGGKGYSIPISLMILCNGSIGKPPDVTSQAYAATIPPGFVTLNISATPFLGSGTKNMTRAITEASNLSF